MTADELKALLGLVPLESEGGHFAETYRSREAIPAGVLGPGWETPRALATAIYYLLTPGTFSALHRLRSDEIFHFYLGDPVEMLQLGTDGEGRLVVLGSDLAAGMRLQVVVRAGVWQGTRLRAGGNLALLGTTMSPGFDRGDFELGRGEELVAVYPHFRAEITALAR